MMNDNDAPLQLNRLYEEFFERGLQGSVASFIWDAFGV